MGTGGARPNAGRPRKYHPRVPIDEPEPTYDKPSSQLLTTDPILYFEAILMDPNASVQRKDRAAHALLTVKARQGGVGKRELAEQGAKLAGWKSHWWSLLNDTESPTFNPDGLTDEDRIAWEAKRHEREAKWRQKAEAQAQAEAQAADRAAADPEPAQRSLPTIMDVIDARNAELGDWLDPATGKSDE